MLGPGLFGLLLDPPHPGGSRLHPDLLPGGRGLSGSGCRGQHDPGLEHAEHSEPVRHPVLLAGHQVQGHGGEFISGVRHFIKNKSVSDPEELLRKHPPSLFLVAGVASEKRRLLVVWNGRWESWDL